MIVKGEADRLITNYLARLRESTTTLPPTERDELRNEIESHIAEARNGIDPDDSAAVQAILTSLGTPEQIAAAARGGTPPTPSDNRTTGQRVYDGGTLVLLAIGGICPPVVGWIIGVAMLWFGPRWTLRDKLLGTLVFPLGPAGPLLLGGPAAFLTATPTVVTTESGQQCYGTDTGMQTCDPVQIHTDDAGWLATGLPFIVVLAIFFVGSVVVLGHLFARAARHGRARAPETGHTV